MKRIAGVLIIVMLSTAFVSAQFITFGVKGGLNYSKLKFDDVKNIQANNYEYDLQSDEAFQGFHIGVMSRVKLFSLFVQPELIFNTTGGKVLVERFSDGPTYEEVATVKYSKIDLPVMVGLKIGPARVNAGPVASVVLSKDSELQEIIPNLTTISNGATVGYQAGVGLDLFNLITIDYRFESGLSKWGDQIEVGGREYAFDSRNSMHMLSLGIMF